MQSAQLFFGRVGLQPQFAIKQIKALTLLFLLVCCHICQPFCFKRSTTRQAVCVMSLRNPVCGRHWIVKLNTLHFCSCVMCLLQKCTLFAVVLRLDKSNRSGIIAVKLFLFLISLTIHISRLINVIRSFQQYFSDLFS